MDPDHLSQFCVGEVVYSIDETKYPPETKSYTVAFVVRDAKDKPSKLVLEDTETHEQTIHNAYSRYLTSDPRRAKGDLLKAYWGHRVSYAAKIQEEEESIRHEEEYLNDLKQDLAEYRRRLKECDEFLASHGCQNGVSQVW